MALRFVSWREARTNVEYYFIYYFVVIVSFVVLYREVGRTAIFLFDHFSGLTV